VAGPAGEVFAASFPFVWRPKRSGVRARDGPAARASGISTLARRYNAAVAHTPPHQEARMNDTRYDVWLNIGSVILILMLVASFITVFRAALSAH